MSNCINCRVRIEQDEGPKEGRLKGRQRGKIERETNIVNYEVVFSPISSAITPDCLIIAIMSTT